MPHSFTIDGLAELVPLARVFKTISALHVAEVVAGLDFERGVVAPLFGIADLVANGVQLAQRFGFGGGAHPVQVFDLVLHGGFNLLGHELRFGLGLRGERAAHKLLAERFAEIAIDRARAGLPARRHGGHAAQGLRIEVEAGLFEGMGEIRRGRRQQVEAQIAAKRRHIFGGELRSRPLS